MIRVWMIAWALLVSAVQTASCSEQIGIEIVPKDVLFGEVEENEVRTEKVFIRNYTEAPVRIDKADCSSESTFAYFLTGQEIAANTTGTIKIVFMGFSLGEHRERVNLALVGTKAWSASIGVSASVIKGKARKPAQQGIANRDAPKVEIEPQRYDFGEVFAPEEVKFQIEVRNRSAAKVNLNVRSGCGCVRTTQLPSLRPGENGSVGVSFDTAGRLGKQEESITIYQDDDTSPIARVKISGTVKTDYTWEPKTISFGRFSWTGEKTRTLTIAAMEMPNLEIRMIKFTEPRIEWRVEQSVKKNRPEYIVEMKLPMNMLPVGQFKELMKIYTNSPHQPELTVPIVGEVRGDLSCVPRTAMFKVQSRGQDLEKTIEIRSDSKRKFAVTRLEVSDDRVIAEEESRAGADSQHTILIRLNGEKIQGFFKAVLKIHTDVKDEPVIELPIYAYLPE
jgi:hypothetical protein